MNFKAKNTMKIISNGHVCCRCHEGDDVIFLCDVFFHINRPYSVLVHVSRPVLKQSGGELCQDWSVNICC